MKATTWVFSILFVIFLTTTHSFAGDPYTPSNQVFKMDLQNDYIFPNPYDPQSEFLFFEKNTPIDGQGQGDYSWAYIYYENGTPTDRKASIVSDPWLTGSSQLPTNKVLKLWLKNPTIEDPNTGGRKGRIQVSFYDDIDGQDDENNQQSYSSLFYRVRMFLPSDFEYVKYYPESYDIYTIGNLWVGEPWMGNNLGGVISITLVKTQGEYSQLYFKASYKKYVGGDPPYGQFEEVWSEVSPYFAPTEWWFDLEVGYKMGDQNTGRFYLGIKYPYSWYNEKVTLMDVTNWTYHPDSPSPIPVTTLQPLKLYGQDNIMDYLNYYGQDFHIFYDDLKVFTDWTPAGTGIQ